MTGTMTSEAARPIPGTSSSASLLASVMNPSTHHSMGARLNMRIAASNQASALAAGTARGDELASEGCGASMARFRRGAACAKIS